MAASSFSRLWLGLAPTHHMSDLGCLPPCGVVTLHALLSTMLARLDGQLASAPVQAANFSLTSKV